MIKPPTLRQRRILSSMTQTPQYGDEKKAQVHEYFARTAESYVASFSHRTGGDLQRLIELGEWKSQQLALDIATGGGHTALAVAPHVSRIVVTDLTPRMLEKWRDPSHGRSCTPEEWCEFFMQAGLLVENIEFFCKTHEYDDWTTRSRMPANEKARLARFILESSPRIQSYFEVVQRASGQLDSFTNDFILLKGRKG